MGNPRPICPECGDVVDPRDCISLDRRRPELRDTFEHDPEDVLSGIYCCGDCIVDAVDRGYPEHLFVSPEDYE